MKRLVVSIGLLVMLFPGLAFAQAEIEHCGTIAGAETWKAGDIHKITCTVEVLESGSLIIEPGATLQIVGQITGSALLVRGGLTLIGTPEKPVIFEIGPFNDGLSIEETAVLTSNLISNVQFKQGSTQLIVARKQSQVATPVTIDHCEFLWAQQGLAVEPHAFVRVVDSLFDRQGIAITARQAKMEILRNKFTNWDDRAINFRQITIYNQLIMNNVIGSGRGPNGNEPPHAISLIGGTPDITGYPLPIFHVLHNTLVDQQPNIDKRVKVHVFVRDAILNFIGNVVAGARELALEVPEDSAGSSLIVGNLLITEKDTSCMVKIGGSCRTFESLQNSLNVSSANLFEDDLSLMPHNSVFDHYTCSGFYCKEATTYDGLPRIGPWDVGAFERAIVTNKPAIHRVNENVEIVLQGHNFDAVNGMLITPESGELDLTEISATVISATELLLRIKATTGQELGDVTLYIANSLRPEIKSAFTVVVKEWLKLDNLVTPNSGNIGDAVVITLTGTALDDVTEDGIDLGDPGLKLLEIVSQTPTELKLKVDITNSATTGAKTITITTADKASASANQVFTVLDPAVPTTRCGLLSNTSPGCANGQCVWKGRNEITCKVTVQPGITLTIEEGAEIRFTEASSELVVLLGGIAINGSASRPVRFIADGGGKIGMVSPVTTQPLSWFTIEGFTEPVDIRADGQLKINNMRLQHVGTQPALWLRNPTASTVELTDFVIEGGSHSIHIDGANVVTLQRGTIYGFSSNGVRIQGTGTGHLLQNLIIANPLPGSTTHGVYVSGAAVATLRFNTIYGGNNVGNAGVRLDADLAHTLQGNQIVNFSVSQIYYKGDSLVWHDNNLFGGFCQFYNIDSFTCIPSSSWAEPNSSNLNLDPKFLDPEKLNFQMDHNAAPQLIDRVVTANITVDRDGVKRVGNRDIGAIERMIIDGITPNSNNRGTSGTYTLSGRNFPDDGVVLQFLLSDSVDDKLQVGAITLNNGSFEFPLQIDTSAAVGLRNLRLESIVAPRNETRRDGLFEVKNLPPAFGELPMNVECTAGFGCKVTIEVCDPEAIALTLQVEVTSGTEVSTPLIKQTALCQFELTFNTPKGSDTQTVGLKITASDDLTSASENVEIGVEKNTAPTIPELTAPVKNSKQIRETDTGLLTIKNSTDDTPVPDLPTQYFCYFSSSSSFPEGAETIVVGPFSGDPSGETTCTTDKLVENGYYYVKVRAVDGGEATLYSESTTQPPFQIFFNAVNDAPGTPEPQSPSDGTSVDTFKPTLSAKTTTDPDGDDLSYTIEVASDAEFKQPVKTADGLTGTNGSVTLTLDQDLEEDKTYYWRIVAVDEHGLAGTASATQSFTVNTFNGVPTVPIPLTPADLSQLSVPRPTLTVTNSTDPEGDPVSYLFEIDTVNTFDSPALLTSGSVSEATDETGWTLTADLKDSTTYYWRVRASDGIGNSDWSTVFSFSVSGLNHAPTVPVPLSPVGGQLVDWTSAPEFSVQKPTDEDGDTITLTIEIYSDSSLNTLVRSVTSIAVASGANTSWTYDQTLSDGNYYWRVRAEDDRGAKSEWSATQNFVVKLATVLDGADVSMNDGDSPGQDNQKPDTTSFDGSISDDSGVSDLKTPSDDAKEPQADAASDSSSAGDGTGTGDSGSSGCSMANSSPSSMLLWFTLLLLFGVRRRRR